MCKTIEQVGRIITAADIAELKLTKLQAEVAERHQVCVARLTSGELVGIQACRRCGGSGHFSWCEMYGTRCFGCNAASNGKRIGWETTDAVKMIKRLRSYELADARHAKREAEAKAAEAAVEIVATRLDLIKSAESMMRKIASRKRDRIAELYVIGKRQEMTVTFNFAKGFESFYGERVLVNMTDAEGHAVIWWTNWNAFPGEFEAGDSFTVKATVKSLEDYTDRMGRTVPQVIVNRLKVA